ncbi:MAG: VOC family protein [Gammaproteobacteria bacterium]|jgi:catechol 2,3-dioxygenase-like lactoylglutathione lyase family enzyme
MQVKRIDHLVLTVADIEQSVEFYSRVMGMQRIEFGEGRIALGFGVQKINLHQRGREFSPRAGQAQAGSADLCFVIEEPVEHALEELRDHGVEVVEGPVPRTGAQGEIVSVYFRDPDENLIEVCNYVRE